MILVTGGAEYIGSHTVVEMLTANLDLLILDNLSNSSPRVVDAVERIAGRRPLVVDGDIRDKDGLRRIFDEHAIDGVVHFAGLKAVGESVDRPLRYYDNNVAGSLALFEAMADAGVFRLVFSSSATVYGDPRSVPIREDFPLQATNPYGRTKLMIEDMLRDLAAADPRWRVALLRYFNPVGAHPSGMIGEDPQGIPNNLTAITGIGIVSPHGGDPHSMFDALLRGESAVRPVFPELARPPAAATATFDVERWFTKLLLPGVDRVSQLAVAAASLALRDAAITQLADPLRVGVYVGCGMGGAAALEAAYASGAKSGRIPPLTVPAFMPNAPAAHVAMRHGITGPVLTYSIACASSAVALAEAAKALRHGDVDVAIAGGSEALIVPGVVQAWQALQTLASFAPGEAATCCRPFAAERTGFVLGEGAAFGVMESDARVRARGARIYPRID